MKTILAAVDFSKISRRVIAEAVRLAKALEGKLVIVHAVKPPPIVTDIAPIMGEMMEMNFAIERSGKRALRRMQERLGRQGLTVETVCEQGFPAGIIVTHAARVDADFIVIGSHGHSAFYDIVVGSTTSGVLKRAGAPVVVVPAQREAQTKARRPKAST